MLISKPLSGRFQKVYTSPTLEDDIFPQFTETFKKEEKGPTWSVLAHNDCPSEIFNSIAADFVNYPEVKDGREKQPTNIITIPF